MKGESSAAHPVQDQKKNQNQNSTKWYYAIATFFGVGYLKPGPGTWASLAAVLLWAAAAWGLHPSPHVLLFILLIAIALTAAVGVPAATAVEKASGRTDPGFVVIDEVIGQWIALLWSPAGWRHGLVDIPLYGLIGLVLFRILDITKPFPVRRLERLPGGWGIVFDDVGAGLYALCIAAVLRTWI